jgi:hypothetical protein
MRITLVSVNNVQMDVQHVRPTLYVILAKTDSNWTEIHVFQDVLVDSSSIIVNV